jgi:hypothetical protein
MADDFGISEGNRHECDNRQCSCSSPGSESVACSESEGVNVGYPKWSRTDASINKGPPGVTEQRTDFRK